MGVEVREPRAECPRCGRPVRECYCAHVTPLPTRTRVLVLCHPREADNPVGTARIARLCLPAAELVVGVALAEHATVRAALADDTRPAIVLYPSEHARDLGAAPPTGPVTLIVIDGTWSQSRSLVRHNPWLEALPHYAFRPEKPSEYRIRREPQPDFVSTIEALAEALSRLEGDGRTFEELRAPFRAMVALQVAHAERSSGGRRRDKRRLGADAPSRLPAELLSETLVCFAGEANSWPHDPELGRPRYRPELVQLVLARVTTADGTLRDATELFARPSAPLATSPFLHARLSPTQLDDAPSFATLVERACHWLGEDPVVCTWGPYASGLFTRDGARLPGRLLDVRKVIGDVTRTRPGSLEQTVQRLALAHAPEGRGRGGERMGMLLAVVRWLASEARLRGVAQTRPTQFRA